MEPSITPEQACRDIEEIAGTGVEVFTKSMGRGDETFSHPTGFGEVYGSNVGVDEWPQAEGLEYVRWMADSTRAGAEIAAFAELAKGTSCRIGGGLERFSKVYGYAGNDMLYAAASSFWHQGASCIYLFNYDCHRLPKTGSDAYTPDEIQLLREIDDPRLIARRNKRYTVSVDLQLNTPERGARCRFRTKSGNQARVRCSASWSGTTSSRRGGSRPWPTPGCGLPGGSTTPPWWRHRSP